ncbi:MAG: hypothetical protein C5B58_07665 [Acidobacteria bacterium]|nr:MAG: hypothetical protein C5B58_07665 [Acidobacteriota bacterium]
MIRYFYRVPADCYSVTHARTRAAAILLEEEASPFQTSEPEPGRRISFSVTNRASNRHTSACRRVRAEKLLRNSLPK